MIRVLHIGLSEQFGGIESFLLNLNREINHNNYHFDYIAYSAITPREEEFTEHGEKIYHLTKRHNLNTYIKELFMYMNNNYDIIHIHKNSAADFVPFLCAKHVPKAKIIAHAHNTRSGGGIAASFFSVFGRRVVVTASDYRLACSSEAGEWLYGNKAKVDAFVPNGIDLAKFSYNALLRKKVREKLNVENDIIVGCVGRFKKEKNQIFLLEVLKELLSLGVSAKILYLGDGNRINKIMRAYDKENLSNRAIFLGNVRDVSSFMQAMDVLAIPSFFEGFPLVAVEGQAASLPVLVSDRVTREVCLSGLVKVLPIGRGTASAWAKACLQLHQEHARGKEDLSGLLCFSNTETAKQIDIAYKKSLKME